MVIYKKVGGCLLLFSPSKDNTNSRIHFKLVYVYIVTYVEEEWEQYNKEIVDLQFTVVNFTVSTVQENLRNQTLKNEALDKIISTPS